MNSNIDFVHDWLRRRYEALGINLDSDASKKSSAVWQSVDSKCAHLYDREIGAWVRFSSIEEATNVSDLVQADVRWALEAVSRLEIRSGIPADEGDVQGAWQIHVVWIVPSDRKDPWERALRDLRSRSAHPEEIGIDLIDLSSLSLEQSLCQDGIPCLLLDSRALLRRSLEAMPEWLSPDALFESRIRKLPESISDPDQRKFTERMLERVFADGATLTKEKSVVPPPSLGKLVVRNFRNVIEAELSIGESEGATIIHGPNGTGKSSIFEATCLAILGTSNRHVDVLSDKDVNPSIRNNYVKSILTRYGADASQEASVIFDGKEVLSNLESNVESAKQRLDAGRGTVLAQECARDFVEMSSAQLAALVLGDYSPRARQIQAEIERDASAAKQDWQNWLRELGLNVTITKPETILRKLVTSITSSQYPPESQGVIDWLQLLGERFPEYEDRARLVRTQWADLDSSSGREVFAERVASSIEKSGLFEAPFVGWLSERNRVWGQICDLVLESKNIIDPIRVEWATLKQELTSWADWLNQPTPQTEVVGNENIESNIPSPSQAIAAEKNEAIRSRLSELAPLGQLLKARKEHFSFLQENLLSNWHKSHAHTCPTCDTDLPGDIANIVTALAHSVTEDYTKVRAEYASLQSELTVAQKDVVTSKTSPISETRIAEISALLRLPAAGTGSLEAIFRISRGSASSFCASVERLLVSLKLKPVADIEAIESAARDIGAKVLAMRIDGAIKQELPNRWDSLKKSVDETALDIVSNHLPSTLGSVWNELALTLSPARWNRATSPKMSTDLKRGAERLGIVAQRATDYPEIPVRHILNQAEQHVLGLAWFFTRYLSHGRFFAPLIVVDDPAQEMDQVTYRKFVRFLQAFMRMHQSLERKLSVLIFLHQEERALDLARAISTDGALIMLEWAKEIRSSGVDSTVRTLQLRNAEQRAPLPKVFLRPQEHRTNEVSPNS